MRSSFTSRAALVLFAATAARAQLHQLAVAAGKKYFGSATDNGQLHDAAYTDILSNSAEFGQITVGNTQKWYYTEKEQGVFNYSQADVIVDLAQKNKQIVRCHTLVWHNQLPSWVTSGSWTNDTLVKAMQAHIASEVGHFKGNCYAWDVVNEALADDGAGSYRSSIFFDTIGEAYIPLAFSAAAEADPDAKLYYNDYSIEFPGAKTTAAQRIVDLVRGAGAKIDGIGLQAHLVVGKVSSAKHLAGVLNEFVAKGVEVAYTELDIRHPSLPPTETSIAQQATDYANVVNACLQVHACVGITVWDLTDKYSWIPSTFPGQGDALLYDRELQKKPAWNAIFDALTAAAAAAPPPPPRLRKRL